MINHKKIAVAIVFIGLFLSIMVGQNIQKVWVEQSQVYDVYQKDDGVYAYLYRGEEVLIRDVVPYHSSPLNQDNLSHSFPSDINQQWIIDDDGIVKLLKPVFHFGVWSLLPAFLTVCLCLVTREPLSALFLGIVSGAILLGKYDITNEIIIPNLAKEGTAALVVLYLWLLGGLLGIWAKTGAAQAFAHVMTKKFVRGQRSAKLVSWLLGVLFFQGGSISTVLVGTTVRPLADKANVSHEEMSYIVDSTASPIAAVLAFNAWPAYVQALIFVPGAAFLATESDRLAFFFSSIPFSFYGILAVLGTFLLSLNITTFSGKRIRMAHQRALKTGQLDAPGARPMGAKDLHVSQVPENYRPHYVEFVFPLILLISIAVISFFLFGSPKVTWAFSVALLLSIGIALVKGMALHDVVDGLNIGYKGVVFASIILVMAVIVGNVSKATGGGLYLVSLLGNSLPFWLLPITLQVIAMIIAFSTGTSWGTYAIAFPLAMPLAWAISQNQALANPEVYMMICFATVLNGSIYGDQCSPISDTTVLSSMTTGCDLMDHVKSQIFPASFAAALAGVLWTLAVIFLAN